MATCHSRRVSSCLNRESGFQENARNAWARLSDESRSCCATIRDGQWRKLSVLHQVNQRAAKTKMASEVFIKHSLHLDSLLAGSRALVEVELNSLLPSAASEPAKIHQAIRWSIFAGGKRFRPGLLLATGVAFGASVDALLRTACAFEMIHTYSLIHDDLPAMDDDDLRRGLPTCHVRFDEATAILAGDALQTLAFRSIAEDDRLDAQTRIVLISELAKAAGTPDGMVAGQALDMEAETRQVNGSATRRDSSTQDGSADRRCCALWCDYRRRE